MNWDDLYPNTAGRPYRYTRDDINQVEEGSTTLAYAAREVGFEGVPQTTLLPPGVSEAPTRPDQAAEFLSVPLFPELMDDDLKLRLSRHPTVEGIIILLSAFINAKKEFERPDVLLSMLKTYSLFSLGSDDQGAYCFSLDPFYDRKLEEKMINDANRARRRRLQEVVNGKAPAPPPEEDDSTVRDEGKTVEEAMNEVYGNTSTSRVPEYHRAYDIGDEGEPSEPPASAKEDEPMLDPDENEASWADANDEEIQSFVDDNLRMAMYMTITPPFRVYAFKFTLGKPIKLD